MVNMRLFSTWIDSGMAEKKNSQSKTVQIIKEAPTNKGEKMIQFSELTKAMKVWTPQGCNYCGCCQHLFEFWTRLVFLLSNWFLMFLLPLSTSRTFFSFTNEEDKRWKDKSHIFQAVQSMSEGIFLWWADSQNDMWHVTYQGKGPGTSSTAITAHALSGLWKCISSFPDPV